MNKDLIIVGAGGFAKEVNEWAIHAGYNVIGFYDETKPELGMFLGKPMFGVRIFDDCPQFIVAIGDNNTRHTLAFNLQVRGGRLVEAIVHPKAVVASDVVIGKGSIICPGVVVCPNVTIGEGVIVNLNSTIGHDSIISNYVNIAPGANLSGFSTIGLSSYIGTNAAIREKITVGMVSTVGMGAVVVKDVEPGKVVVGNPAKIKE